MTSCQPLPAAVLILLLASVLAVPPASAVGAIGAEFVHRDFIKASNPDAVDRFGQAVSIDGSLVVVGARREGSASAGINSIPDNAASSAGAVYVFQDQPGELIQQAYLKASNSEAGDEFGAAVDVSGNRIVVGAPREDSGSTGVNSIPDEAAIGAGAVYIFSFDGSNWAQEAYLKSDAPSSLDAFGDAVAIDGDTVAVGVPFEDGSAAGVNGLPDDDLNGAGAVYIFVREPGGWIQQAYIKSPNPDDFDGFGHSVALSGDTLLVGARGADVGEFAFAGSAFVYHRDGGVWSYEDTLVSPIPDNSDSFGEAVSLSGNTAVVGSPGEDSDSSGVDGDPNENASGSGAAFVFSRGQSGWGLDAFLKASNPDFDDQFGSSVSIRGDIILVGAPNEDSSATGVDGVPDEQGFYSGAAYLFRRDDGNWTLRDFIKGPRVDLHSAFGESVGLTQDRLLIGAPGEDSSAGGINAAPDELAQDAGAAYLMTPLERFTLGGLVSGLVGSGLVLGANGEGTVEITANGAFSFPQRISDGTVYEVTVLSQPENPNQICTIQNATGVASGNDIDDLAVSCVAGALPRIAIEGSPDPIFEDDLDVLLLGTEFNVSVTDPDGVVSQIDVVSSAPEIVSVTGVEINLANPAQVMISITPEPDRYGEVVLSLVAVDNEGNRSSPESIAFEVVGINDPPSFELAFESVTRAGGFNFAAISYNSFNLGTIRNLSPGPYESESVDLSPAVESDPDGIIESISLARCGFACDGVRVRTTGRTGTATLAIRVVDAFGTMSLPQSFQITITPSNPDSAEDDDVAERAVPGVQFEASNVVNLSQFPGSRANRTFHDASDEDWFVYSNDGQSLRFIAGYGIDMTIGGVGLVADLYRPLNGQDGVTTPDLSLEFIERLVVATTGAWVQAFPSIGNDPADRGIYYLHVQQCRNTSEAVCAGVPFPEAGASYGIEMPRRPVDPTQPSGTLSASIVDACSRRPIPFAYIGTSGNEGAFSDSSGQFILDDNVGSYTGNVYLSGELVGDFSFSVFSNLTTQLTVEVFYKDIYCDGFEP